MKAKFNAVMIGTALALGASGAPVYAQTQSNAPQAVNPGADNINWNAAEMRNGLSADRLIGMDVTGKNGNSIGEVQHILANTQGQVTAIVIESGGFANIGDTHFRVPWNEVQFGRDMDHVIVPVTEQTAERYQDRSTAEKVQTSIGEFRLSQFMDKDIVLRGGRNYGEVQDIILSRDGHLKALVVDTDFGPGGLRAVPFAAAKFDTAADRVDLAYDEAQANRARPFDYAVLDIVHDRKAMGTTRGTGGTGATSGGADARDMNPDRSNIDRGARPARSSRG